MGGPLIATAENQTHKGVTARCRGSASEEAEEKVRATLRDYSFELRSPVYVVVIL